MRECLVDLVGSDQTVKVDMNDRTVEKVPASAPSIEARQGDGGIFGEVVGEDDDSEGGADAADHKRVGEIFDGLFFCVADPEGRDEESEGTEPEEGVDDEEHLSFNCFFF